MSRPKTSNLATETPATTFSRRAGQGRLVCLDGIDTSELGTSRTTYGAPSSKLLCVALRSTAKTGRDGRHEGSPLPRLDDTLDVTPPAQARAASDIDDATLARAGLAGHDWAHREIWFRFAPMVFALLRRSLGQRHDPEDLLQEVFLRVFARLGTLDNPGALRSFVYSFAVRVVSEEIRRHRIRSRLGAIFFRAVAEPSVPHVDFESRELLSRLSNVLDRLDSRHRAVFVLRRFEGMELTEIAASLDLSLATVKRDLEKANAYLARAIHRDDKVRGHIDARLASKEGGARP